MGFLVGIGRRHDVRVDYRREVAKTLILPVLKTSQNTMSLSRRDTASGRCEGALAATEESRNCGIEILRFAQDDILR